MVRLSFAVFCSYFSFILTLLLSAPSGNPLRSFADHFDAQGRIVNPNRPKLAIPPAEPDVMPAPAASVTPLRGRGRGQVQVGNVQRGRGSGRGRGGNGRRGRRGEGPKAQGNLLGFPPL